MNNNSYEKLKKQVWDMLKDCPSHKASVWHHFCGVAVLCAFLGLKRGLDADICKCAGLLHDLWLFLHFPLEYEMHRKHGYIGSELAQKILAQNGGYSEQQIEIICKMIYNHNDKDTVDDVYSETLKDADALEHDLNQSDYDKKYNDHGRIEKILDEFMIKENG